MNDASDPLGEMLNVLHLKINPLILIALDGDLTKSIAIFNYIEDRQTTSEDKYDLKSVVFSDEETDIAVIELEHKHEHEMPLAFLNFTTPVERFCLIGHSRMQVMKLNSVTKVFRAGIYVHLEADIERVKELSGKHTNAPCEIDAFEILSNKDRFLFHCKFTKGASGSPGIALVGRTMYVTTVLLRGYPDWYYDPKHASLTSTWSIDDCIEQGANMQSVRRNMHNTDPELCKEIFGDQLC